MLFNSHSLLLICAMGALAQCVWTHTEVPNGHSTAVNMAPARASIMSLRGGCENDGDQGEGAELRRGDGYRG
jgi:hypothetical protein